MAGGGGGRIIEWVRQIDRDGWDCVIMADESVCGPPWQGRYAFGPRSIRAMTRPSHRLIWLVPSNQVSNFRHDQPRTLMDNGGHHARGQVCEGPDSPARYLGSGRRG